MNIARLSIERSGPGVDLSNQADGESVRMSGPVRDLEYARNALTLTFDPSGRERVRLAFRGGGICDSAINGALEGARSFPSGRKGIIVGADHDMEDTRIPVEAYMRDPAGIRSTGEAHVRHTPAGTRPSRKPSSSASPARDRSTPWTWAP